MSRLFYSDTGRAAFPVNEELSCWRRARKRLLLPERLGSGGTLFVYAHPHRGHEGPLRLRVNGHEAAIPADGVHTLCWHRLEIPPEWLRTGSNTVELWADTRAMDGWVLGIEGAARDPDSALSFDGGATWQSERMGIHHSLCGEYLVRLRLHDPNLHDPDPPAFAWEAPDSPRLPELREVVPREIHAVADSWERARALASWVAGQWRYVNDGAEYAPWDPLTILSWGRSALGQVSPNPTVMCVHYGVVFTSAALALGLPARCLCSTGDLAGGAGHFVSEVWVERWRKWCQVDANCDLVYMREGVPLSVGELYAEGERLGRWVQPGPGFEALSGLLKEFVREHLLTGAAFRRWAVWPRNDFLTHPELTPPGHGAGAYCETDWVWARGGDPDEMGMFPYHADAGALSQPTNAPFE